MKSIVAVRVGLSGDCILLEGTIDHNIRRWWFNLTEWLFFLFMWLRWQEYLLDQLAILQPLLDIGPLLLFPKSLLFLLGLLFMLILLQKFTLRIAWQ